MVLKFVVERNQTNNLRAQVLDSQSEGNAHKVPCCAEQILKNPDWKRISFFSNEILKIQYSGANVRLAV